MNSNEVVHIHIHPGARWRGLGIADVWAYRGLLMSLGLRDLKLRYKQTVLGVLWVILQPILSAGIMTVVFGYVANVPSPEGVPYFVFAYLGQMAWTLFSLTLTRTSGSMLGSMAIVMKIYFPRPILPFATIISVLLDFAIAFTLAVPMIVLYGQGIPNLPVTLLCSVLLVLCATGIGFVLAAVSVKYRDVLFVLPLLIQVGMYASPVAYPLEVAADNLPHYSAGLFELYMLNPLVSLISAFRRSLLGQPLILPHYLYYSALMAFAIFAAGFAIFRSSEGKFADVI
jgi:lipopolysaccharide transport system permease protein